MNEDVKNQIIMRSKKPNGIAQGIGNAGMLLFGGKPKESEPNSDLETLLKINQLETGSPEFKMKEAQTRADIELQKGLDLERAKKAQAQADYDAALQAESNHTQPIQQQLAPSIPSGIQMPQAGPSMPTAMPEKTGGVPKFITNQEPGKREYNEKTGRFETKPGNVSTVKNPDYQGALSGTAGQYAGSVQGLKAIDDIQKILGLQKDPTGKVSFKDPNKAKLNIIGSKAAGFNYRVPFGLGEIIPGLEPGISAIGQMGAGEEARNLDLAYQTLAEDVLRARTGAAAPEPEQVRELARTFARFQDTPENIYKRLEQNGIFLETSANTMKPEGQVARPTLPDAQDNSLPPEIQALAAKGFKVTKNG